MAGTERECDSSLYPRRRRARRIQRRSARVLMPQFALYRNRNPVSRTRFPLLLDIQSDLLEPLATRVVVPLTPAGSVRARSMRTLTPILNFDGKKYLMLTPQVAGISARQLGPVAGNLAADRDTIVAAIDFLLAGT